MAGLLTHAAARSRPAAQPLVVHFVRHGQATHNVRAEVAREAGCSHEEFIAAMKADDEVDAELTHEGREQARAAAAKLASRQQLGPGEGGGLAHLELIVCSPLSRAVETASLVFGEHAERGVPFVSYEGLREWNGYLLNAQRRPRVHLAQRFPHVDFSAIPESDESWTAELEAAQEVAMRGVAFLEWLCSRPERHVAVVAHGGIYSTLFAHPAVDEGGYLAPRFGNCELRSVELRVVEEEGGGEADAPRLRRFAFTRLGDGR
jgi:broad specificity phosphatase PhoE